MPSSGASSSAASASRSGVCEPAGAAGRWPGWRAASARNSCCRPSARWRSATARQYDEQPEAVAGGLPAAERSHNRIVQAVVGTMPGGLSGGALARLEGRHRLGGNALRAAVLGANDGLVSNLSLVMGVAGAVGLGSAHPADRPRRPGRRRLLHGHGRMAVGHQLARAEPAADRRRGRRAGTHARGGEGGDGPDLPGQGAARGRRRARSPTG